jgi:hypothetical protein
MRVSFEELREQLFPASKYIIKPVKSKSLEIYFVLIFIVYCLLRESAANLQHSHSATVSQSIIIIYMEANQI